MTVRKHRPAVTARNGKAAAWEFAKQFSALDESRLRGLAERYLHPDLAWHGPHPIDDLAGRDAWVESLWLPLLAAVPDIERRDDLFFAGEFEGRQWVCASGHYFGSFRGDWLGIPATGGLVDIRYGEFHAMEDGLVAESYVILDVLDVMRQAGVWLLPPSLGAERAVPGPKTRDGVLLEGADAAESARSLALVEDMLFEGLAGFDRESLRSMGNDRYWHPDMMWYGPAGIGTTRGIAGFQDWHQRPFLAAFPDRKGGNHKARFAEDMYVASTGWPSLTATHTGGGWLGLAPTGRKVGMRVMDFWRREGDLLVENWVFIDIADVLLQLGYDVFERLRLHLRRTRAK